MDDTKLREAAISLRDTGTLDGLDLTLHPSVDDDYETALKQQWGGPMPRWLQAAKTKLPADHADQRGRRALITGGSSGVGFFVAKLLAAVGLVVVLPARPGLEFETRGAAAAILAELPEAKVEVPEAPLDLASFTSVRNFSAHMRDGGLAIDVLCLNAARSGSGRDQRKESEDKEEVIMQVNLLSHALLVRGLLPNLQRSRFARIVAHSAQARAQASQSYVGDLRGKGFTDTAFSQYALSKAALCLYTRALNLRLSSAGITGAALLADPGLAATSLNYQHDVVRTLGLSRRGVKDTKAYHDGYALHAADAALPMVMAALTGVRRRTAPLRAHAHASSPAIRRSRRRCGPGHLSRCGLVPLPHRTVMSCG